MNDLISNTQNLQPISRNDAKIQIGKLFVGLAVENKGAFNDALMALYLEAVSDIPKQDVEKAAHDFVTGKTGNCEFAPKPAQFARYARKLTRERLAENKRAAQLQRQMLEAQNLEKIRRDRTPGSIDRVREMLKSVSASLKMQDGVNYE